MIIIKKYHENYKTQIIKLILDIQTKEFNLPVTIEDQPDLENISDVYQKGKGNFWVALDKEKVIGTIGIVDLCNRQVAIKKMFVMDQYRGTGVSQMLLDSAMTFCKNSGVGEIYLGTTSSYLAAHRFYEKNGFQEIEKKFMPPAYEIHEVETKFYRLCICYKD